MAITKVNNCVMWSLLRWYDKSGTHICGRSSHELACSSICEIPGYILGVSYTQRSAKDGRRSSVAAGYLRPAMSRSNLDVLVRKHVTKVINTTHCVVTRATLGLLPMRGIKQMQFPPPPPPHPNETTQHPNVSGSIVRLPTRAPPSFFKQILPTTRLSFVPDTVWWKESRWCRIYRYNGKKVQGLC